MPGYHNGSKMCMVNFPHHHSLSAWEGSLGDWSRWMVISYEPEHSVWILRQETIDGQELHSNMCLTCEMGEDGMVYYVISWY